MVHPESMTLSECIQKPCQHACKTDSIQKKANRARTQFNKYATQPDPSQNRSQLGSNANRIKQDSYQNFRPTQLNQNLARVQQGPNQNQNPNNNKAEPSPIRNQPRPNSQNKNQGESINSKSDPSKVQPQKNAT